MELQMIIPDQNAIINYNYIEIGLAGNWDWNNAGYVGIRSHDSEIKHDTIIINTSNSCYTSYAIESHRSVIDSNYIGGYHMGDCGASLNLIRSYGTLDNRSSVKHNEIHANGAWGGINASFSDILNNTISSNSDLGGCCEEEQYAIGWGSENIILSNTISDMHNGIYLDGYENTLIDSNLIQVDRFGIRASDSDSLIITNNTIQTDYNTIITTTNGASIITNNLLMTSSGRGIHCENQAGIEFSNNTMVSSSGGDYAMHISNLSAPVVRNNIIQGFQNGIYADNTLINYSLSYNNMWQIVGNRFEGTALPPLIGDPISVNANGTISDIYGNINVDPMFLFAWGGNYNLNENSPCINAGDPDSDLDEDFTIADMGAFPYYITPVFGCTDTSATNYDDSATVDDESCVYCIQGCMDQSALILIHLQIAMMVVVFHLFMVV